jgi:hypothetical protein
MLIDTSNKAKKLISYKNADQKILTNLKGKYLGYSELQDVVSEMRGALQIAYPGYAGLG